jgi:hypothetical protein
MPGGCKDFGPAAIVLYVGLFMNTGNLKGRGE